MNVWESLSGFGDAALMLPEVAVVWLWLTVQRAWRHSLGWGAFLLLAAGFVVATKIAWLGWGVGVNALGFTGISGHATLSAAVLPVAAWLILIDADRRLRRAGVTAGVLLAISVSVSRLALCAHSPIEVVTGFVLGSAVAALLIGMPVPARRPVIPAWVLLIGVLGVGVLTYGDPAPSQQLIIAIAEKASGRDLPPPQEVVCKPFHWTASNRI